MSMLLTKKMKYAFCSEDLYFLLFLLLQPGQPLLSTTQKYEGMLLDKKMFDVEKVFFICERR